MFINCKFIDFLLECTYCERHAHVCGELNFATPDTSCSSQQAPEKRTSRYEMEDQRLQLERLLWTRWEDGQLSEHGCFAWSIGCAWATTHTISGVLEPYEQLLPARIYAAYQTGTSDQINTLCRVCGNVPENLAHFLAGCLSLAQTK